jgi:hypothetical protein
MTTKTKSNDPIAEARAALDTAAAATVAARGTLEKAEAMLMRARPKTVVAARDAALHARAELNEAEALEQDARAALHQAELTRDRAELAALREQADPARARQAIAASAAALAELNIEVRAKFIEHYALTTKQRDAAQRANEIAARVGEPGVAMLPEGQSGAACVAALHDVRDRVTVAWRFDWSHTETPEEAYEQVLALLDQAPHATQGDPIRFRSEVADRSAQIKLALTGELEPIVREWLAKRAAHMASVQTSYQLKVDELKAAMTEHAAERSEASQARLKAAQDAFKQKPTVSTAKPFVPPTVFDKANAERDAKRAARGEPAPKAAPSHGFGGPTESPPKGPVEMF